MKKVVQIIFVLLILFVGAAAGATYLFGSRAEDAYRGMLAEIAKDGQLSINITNYERGFLSSRAVATITFTGTPLSMNLMNDIHHGPFPIGAFSLDTLSFETSVPLIPVVAYIKSRISVPLLAMLPPIEAYTTIYLAGNNDTRFEMAAFKQPGTDGNGFESQGMTGNMALNADWKNVKIDFTIPLITVTSPAGKFTLSQFEVNLDQQESPSGLEVGTFAFGINRIHMDGMLGGKSLEGLRISSTSRENAGSIHGNVNVQLRAINDGESNYGPGLLNMQFRNLDAAALVKYKKEMQALQKENLPADEAGPALLAKSLPLITELAKKEPEVEVAKLSFKISEGEITGKGKLILAGNSVDVSQDPNLLLKALNGSGELVFPPDVLKILAKQEVRKELDQLKAQGKLSQEEMDRLSPEKVNEIAEQAAPQYIARVVKNMKLVADGDNYKITASLKNGHLLLNNEPLPQSIGLP